MLTRALSLFDPRALALVALVLLGGCWGTSTLLYCRPPFVDRPMCVLKAPIKAAEEFAETGFRRCPWGQKAVPRCSVECGEQSSWSCQPRWFSGSCTDDVNL